MKKLAVIAALLCACAAASADPPAKAPSKLQPPAKQTPGEAKCQPVGKPIFEARLTSSVGKGPSGLHAIYDNGAYVADATDKDGASTQHVVGVCIDEQQLKSAKEALKQATWTITTAKIRCMARSTITTTYNVDGKEVFADTTCSGKSLDEKSAASLETLKQILLGPSPQ